MHSRWDALLGTKPVSLVEHLLEEVSKQLASDLLHWPPAVEEIPGTANPFRPLFEPGHSPPPSGVYAEAFRLVRWELDRELAAYDDYVRNHRWLEHGLSPSDKQALLFLSRWLLEQMLSLGEATCGRVKRSEMKVCMERTEHRLQPLLRRREENR